MSTEQTERKSTHQSHLCAHCRNILDNWSKGFGNKEVHFPHYPDPLQLEQSANKGCTLCTQFVQGALSTFEEVKDHLRSREPERFHARVVIDDGVRRNRRGRVTTQEPICLEMEYRSLNEADDPLNPRLGFHFHKLSVDFIPVLNPGTSNATNTRNALNTITRWLERCHDSHQQCNRREDHTPTRLVSTAEGRTRLLLASDLPKTPHYATLSHCWGNTQLMCLESRNVESFKNEIPSAALSQTFLDAIEIARELGFPFIWIDSLCIYQDDDGDWMRESAEMSSVYGNSSLNIAAAHGRDGNAGCFIERLPSWRCRLQVEANEQITQYDCVPSLMYRKGLIEMPLGERGWVLQERLLPTRTVHFTSTELFWECHEQTACETFPGGFPKELTQAIDFITKEPLSCSTWDWIVESYTRMHLTYEKDKLAAISGLARVIQSQTGDQYVAGLWRKNLEYQLCWISAAFTEPSARAVPYRAPSWSWVSMEGSISTSVSEAFTDGEDGRLWIRVQDVRLEFLGPDPFGLLSSATLTVDCSCLLRIRLQSSKNYTHSMLLGRQLVSVSVNFDCFLMIHDYNSTLSKDDKTFAMPVLEHLLINKGRVTGLVLEPITQAPGQYRRVGTFYTNKPDALSVFRKAATDPLCRATSKDVIRTWRDPDRKVHNIVDLL